MSNLKRILLLGSPRFEQDGQPVDVNRRKAMALVVYLAMQRQSCSRDALASLLWPEADQSRSRTALRRVLSDLNKALGRSWLDVEGETVCLHPDSNLWIDAEAFLALLQACQTHGHLPGSPCSACVPLLIEAVTLYRDDFLAGFTLPDSPEFDEWQFFEAENLRRQLADALAQLVRYLLAAGSFEAAIPYARRWLALDPLLDAPHYALMQLYARTGQRAAALRQYQEYANILNKELGVGPDREITALHERILRGEEGRSTKTAGNGLGGEVQSPPSPPTPALPPAPKMAEDEIRLVTVLFASLRSASGTGWDLDPEEIAGAAADLFQVVRQAVLRYEARVNRFVGDSVQVVFGTPQAHEDDAERAVRAALEIQSVARRRGLVVAVGISTGQIYFRPSDGADGQEVTMIGPVVNLASRLEDRARAGEILVSATTYRHTRRSFEFAPLNVDIRGAAEPLTVYEVHRPLPHPEKVRGIEGLHARLIGRDEELNRLKFALDAVLHGQGQVVLLTGEAGLGKSRLVAELKQVALAAQDYRASLLWLESRCLELSAATSYWPFIDMLRTFLYQEAGEEHDLAETLVSVLEAMAERGDLLPTRVAEIGALLGNLLSVRFGTSWDDRLKNASPIQIHHQTFLAVYDFFAALAKQRPLVLVFDDLHWADDLSLDLFSLLMETTLTSPIILLCVYRPYAQHKSQHLATIATQKSPGRTTEIRLRELTPSQSRRLLESLLAVDEIPEPVRDLILKKCWGNPFFMEEVIRALIDSGSLYRAEGHWAAREDFGAATVPESLQSVILSRVDRLETDLKRVLRSAAVIGHFFQAQILAEITPPEIDLAQALWALEDAALIYRSRVVPEVEYSFKHVLTQEAVYQTISRQQSAELHLRVAEAMEARSQDNPGEYDEQLAYHYSRSPQTEKAVEYLIRAGEKSRRAYFNKEAIHYFEQALQRLGDPAGGTGPLHLARSERQLAALTGLGQIYHGLGQDAEAEQYLRRAISVAQRARVSAKSLVRLYFWLGEVLHWQGHYSEQVRLGETALALLSEDEAESIEAALMNQTIAIGSIQRGNRELFHTLTEGTARFIRRLPYSEELTVPYAHILYSLLDRKKVARAAEWIQELERLATQHHDLPALALVYDNQALHYFEQGDLNSAAQYFRRTLEIHRNTGDGIHVWRSLGGLSRIYLIQGDLSAAETYARQSLDVADGLGMDLLIAETLVALGIALHSQQNWKEAARLFQQASRLAPDADLFWVRWIAPYGLGRVYLAQGRKIEAREQFELALQSFFPRHVPLSWEQHRWWPMLSGILGGLETVGEDTAALRVFCHRFEAIKALPALPPLPGQWWLEAEIPAHANRTRAPGFEDSFGRGLEPGWVWHDPFEDCSFSTEGGLEIRAANGRDLWRLNRSAPRLLRRASGDFTIQAVCVPPLEGKTDPGGEKPAIGGLLIRHDDANFLRLVLGSRGERILSFEGSIDNEDLIVGQGRLADSGDGGFTGGRIFLRLEMRGYRVRALGSADGERWFSAGAVDFPTDGPLEVGLHAVGWIDRLIYPGAFPDGAAIRFESFQVWT